MSYSVTTRYDNRIPSWPGNGTPTTLIACHDTEGGQGRVGALGTIQFLIDRADRGASYHELWWYHESTDEFGAIRIVSPARAAGSVAPQRDKYTPTTWVKNSLGVNAWDPNQGVYAVSIAGRVADVDRYSRNPKFLAHAHRRMMELWKELGISKRAEHFQFNPATRSDWGRLLMPALGGLVTRDDFRPVTEPTPAMTLMPIAPTLMTVRAQTTIRQAPDLTTGGAWVVGKEAVIPVIAQVPDGVNFGAGPLWFAYVINTGGLRYFHSQDVLSKEVLGQGGDTAALESKVASLTTQVSTLTAQLAQEQAKVQTQAATIAGLKTELATATTALAAARAELASAIEARENAEAAADEATAAAANALALKSALETFLG